jgi:predicted TIM-barrel fold metal-dependent hydrolase
MLRRAQQDRKVVFPTDYPHLDVKYPYAVESFLKLPFSEQTKRKYLWDNCARLYGFGY